jgi:energy-coupling factor transporter ATP-binding protein EcfA2
MAGGQTSRLAIVGKSGSGKSTLARKLILEREKRSQKLVILNRKREFSDLCERAYKIYDDVEYSAFDVYQALNSSDRVFFNILGSKPQKFLDVLGHQLMNFESVQVVNDEAASYLQRLASGYFLAVTAGREQDINWMWIYQMIVSPAGSVAPEIQKQLSHLVSFRLSDPNEAGRFLELVPEARIQGSNTSLVEILERPDPEQPDLPPEWIEKDIDRGTAAAILRHPQNQRKLVYTNLG